MADLTFAEFAESTGAFDGDTTDLLRLAVLERVYDALIKTGVDIRAVVDGQPVLTRDEGALVVGAMPLQAFPVEHKPDLSRLRKLVKAWRRDAARPGAASFNTDLTREAQRKCATELFAALDAIEKGSS